MFDNVLLAYCDFAAATKCADSLFPSFQDCRQQTWPCHLFSSDKEESDILLLLLLLLIINIIIIIMQEISMLIGSLQVSICESPKMK